MGALSISRLHIDSFSFFYKFRCTLPPSFIPVMYQNLVSTISKQTTGSMPNNLVEAAVKGYFNLNKTSDFYIFVKQCLNHKLIQDSGITQAYLPKVDGGRPYNNCLTAFSFRSVLVDIGITSCNVKDLHAEAVASDRWCSIFITV